MNGSSIELGSVNKDVNETGSNVSLGSLSELVGFPVEYLKKELVLDNDEISMDELRIRMLSFLETNFSN